MEGDLSEHEAAFGANFDSDSDGDNSWLLLTLLKLLLLLKFYNE